MFGLLEFLIVILILGWIFGFAVAGIGELIHLLIVIAIIIFLFRLFSGAYGGRGSGGV